MAGGSEYETPDLNDCAKGHTSIKIGRRRRREGIADEFIELVGGALKVV